MISINKRKCIGCRLCIDDCFPNAIGFADGHSILENPQSCIGCGHCIAVCPTAAITDDELNMDELSPVSYFRKPDELLNHMRSRRSCRHFKETPVSEEALMMIINAARACPTAKNLQDIRFIVVRSGIEELRSMALSKLADIGREQLQSATDVNEIRRATNFIKWNDTHKDNAEFDPLFFNAPLLLLFVSKKENANDTAAAAAYSELMACSCELGCLYSGYFCACAQNSSEIREYLSVNQDETVVRCIVIGHPDIKYIRTTPRKSPQISFF